MGTWTHKQNQNSLLRDLLTMVLPNVRFMTYDYNAASRNLTANQEIRSIPASLLCEKEMKRSFCRKFLFNKPGSVDSCIRRAEDLSYLYAIA